MDITLNRIKGLAKSLAPVRKTKPRGGRNRADPAEVRFYRRTTRERVGTNQALAEIGQQVGATAEQAADAINMGDTRKFTNTRLAGELGQLPLKTAKKGNPDTVRRARLVKALADAGLVAKLARRGPVHADTKADVARLHGVRIEFEGNVATAVVGGTLRRSIKVVNPRRTGNVIRGSVRVTAPYAKYVEFPTHRTKAQPFLLPAYKAYAGDATKLAKEIRRQQGSG
jgi:HK97 gp10 family phage protein